MRLIVITVPLLLALFFVLPALAAPLTLTMGDSAPITLAVVPLLTLWVARRAVGKVQ